MKNILMISSLYPGYEGQSYKEINYGLFEITKELNKKFKIFVLRPIIFPKRRKKDIKLKVGFQTIDSIKSYNFGLFKIPFYHKYFILNHLNKVLKRISFKPDVIISSLYDSYMVGLKLSKYYNSKFIMILHNSDYFIIQKNNKRFLKELKKADKIVVLTEKFKQNFLSIYKQDYYEYLSLKNKIKVIPYGIKSDWIISKELFYKKCEIIKNKIKNYKNKKITINFISVCSLIKLKNIDLVIKTFFELSKNVNFNFQYIIIGDGPEKYNLQNLIKSLNLQNQIKLVGSKSKDVIKNYLINSDIFVMVSSPETFGLAYIEAMATGNLIIGTKNEGIDGIIRNNTNGFLTNPEVDQIKEKILKILSLDSFKIVEIFNTMYRTVNKLTIENISKEYEKII